VITLTESERAVLAASHQESKRWAPDTSFDEYIASRIAPDGKLWRCGACGKTIRDQYAENGGWDESCMLNSYLIDQP
jgi:hypothetical protein